MALKKSELYSSLWQSCDELRGGMDASQYKDYVLVLLFVKYVSDSQLSTLNSQLKETIFGHAEFTTFNESATKLFAKWKKASTPHLKGLTLGSHPKSLIETISEDLLATFAKAPLLDAYDVYQHLMDYWNETIQNDCYLIAGDAWHDAAQPKLIIDGKTRNPWSRCAGFTSASPHWQSLG